MGTTWTGTIATVGPGQIASVAVEVNKQSTMITTSGRSSIPPERTGSAPWIKDGGWRRNGRANRNEYSGVTRNWMRTNTAPNLEGSKPNLVSPLWRNQYPSGTADVTGSH